MKNSLTKLENRIDELRSEFGENDAFAKVKMVKKRKEVVVDVRDSNT